MVYFWQKQYRQSRHSSSKSAISPLLSAATTAADTALAAVMAAKSEKRPSQETINDVTRTDSTTAAATTKATTTTMTTMATTTSPTAGSDEVGRVFRRRSSGTGTGGGSGGGGRGGVEREGTSTNDIRGQLSSPSCRGNSGVMTNKIQSLVLDKLSEYAKRKQESNRRRVAERELDSLNLKIDKLLSKMDDGDVCGQEKLLQEEECVVCLAAPATMKTFPCGHRVVCRKCLIKTMQVAISQRCLPLRCVICRNRILSLQHSQDSEKSSAFCLADEGNNRNHSNNANYGGHCHSAKISRSNTTPVITNSTPSKTSFSTPSSPVSQQDFVLGHHHHAAQLSSLQSPSTSHGIPSNGTFHQYHPVIPVQFHASSCPYSLPPKKSGSSKSVKRLLGAR